jgi:hypothetical protein
VAFQTWIGANDGQVLIDLANGRLWSIDHGDVFGSLSGAPDPQVVVTNVPGLPHNHGCNADLVANAVAGVESLDDDAILASVARVPDEAGWQADPARRLAIARWLSSRRDQLREVMKKWQ